MAGGPPLQLTTEERILLYLCDFKDMDERFELPPALTQKAIAYAVAVQRKHLSRYLDELVREGALEERKAHVEAERQRVFAYFLSPTGWTRAMAIKQRLAGVRVPVAVKGATKRMTLEEIDAATSVRLTFSDIVREAMKGPLVMEELEQIDERRKVEMDGRLKKLESYARALMVAWRDGRVTATERLLLEELRENLGVTLEEHDRIEIKAAERALDERRSAETVFGAVVKEARGQGGPTERDLVLFEALRKALGLPLARAHAVEAAVTGAPVGHERGSRSR